MGRKVKVIKNGDVFSDWVVLDGCADKDGKVLCQCSCGRTVRILNHYLLRGSSKRCMSCRYEGAKTGVVGTILCNYAHNAKREGVDFDISEDYIVVLINEQGHKCAISGLAISIPESFDELREFGKEACLDRIIDTKGYVSGNVRWIHRDVAGMKWSIGSESFLQWCIVIANYHENSL